MKIQCNSGRVSIEAPAKLNLFLEVLGRRADGFHEIETVMLPISICDRLVLERSDAPEIELSVTVPAANAGAPSARGAAEVANAQSDRALLDGALLDRALLDPPLLDPAQPDRAWLLPPAHNNLVVRAAEATRVALGVEAGCRISLEKHIPAAAGLGGGSSDAAATVVGCMHLWKRWDRRLATRICARLGSDVPFFLGSESGIGLMKATGRGEILTPIDGRPNLRMLVTHPPVGCATQEVYGLYDGSGDKATSARILDACQNGQSQKIGALLLNALQSPASRLNPWIQRQLALMADFGVESSLMTGSGSSCFGVVSSTFNFEAFRTLAATVGVERVYLANAWHADSVESQLASLPC